VRPKDAELRDHADQLRLTEEERRCNAAQLDETSRQLAHAEDQLRWDPIWLDAIQRTTSWRLAARVRAAKRMLTGA
jgi:hypothetical protein